ncbi:septal ring lytic transglycosylase RlpA family protein [Desulfogranum japonicum]|uniref:septal ring lytic transglycosylase RlpA family protein n=1 Tax=Desulfogranum japonicum TaxID=231447 RepID=UPI0005541FE0|nr:septal ring lytic transglycosylase RlpA family protein [Desulfogranum japonicum]
MSTLKKLIGSALALTLTVMLVHLLYGCTQFQHATPRPKNMQYSETGIASFYSQKLQSRRTASGEKFNNQAMTAAHRTLPFGTKVLVTNVANNKSVSVKINDRGPFVKGRIIDLTRSAFSRIAHTNKGKIKVRIQVIP